MYYCFLTGILCNVFLFWRTFQAVYSCFLMFILDSVFLFLMDIPGGVLLFLYWYSRWCIPVFNGHTGQCIPVSLKDIPSGIFLFSMDIPGDVFLFFNGYSVQCIPVLTDIPGGVFLQKWNAFPAATVCDRNVPCTDEWLCWALRQ